MTESRELELAERVVRATKKVVEKTGQIFYVIDDVPAFIRQIFIEELLNE